MYIYCVYSVIQTHMDLYDPNSYDCLYANLQRMCNAVCELMYIYYSSAMSFPVGSVFRVVRLRPALMNIGFLDFLRPDEIPTNVHEFSVESLYDPHHIGTSCFICSCAQLSSK